MKAVCITPRLWPLKWCNMDASPVWKVGISEVTLDHVDVDTHIVPSFNT
jgi:hypothetical protein